MERTFALQAEKPNLKLDRNSIYTGIGRHDTENGRFALGILVESFGQLLSMDGAGGSVDPYEANLTEQNFLSTHF